MSASLKLLVLHGPNLNLLGSREPEHYGTQTLSEINAMISEAASRLDSSVECRQSNHEGTLVDALQAAASDGFDGVILNGAGLTHTSVVMADAIAAIDLPVVEVHLSNIHAREAFRKHSYTAAHSIGIVSGFGPASYLLGLQALTQHIRKSD